MQHDIELIKNQRRWPKDGEALCLKKRLKPGEKPVSVTGYMAFGVITNNKLPLVVYLRPDFAATMIYQTIEEAVEDGWVVD